jgi:hypothetical protein
MHSKELYKNVHNSSIFFFLLVLGYHQILGYLGPCICQASDLQLEKHFFAFSYFSGRVSHFCQGVVSDRDPPIYVLLYSWDHRCVILYLTYLLRWGLANFLCRLASTCDPSDVCLPSN